MNENISLRMIVEGDVQASGYRALVKYIARNLKIRGFVRNLPDGTVEIFCEGNRKSIENFKEKINIKAKDGGLFSVNVKNIKESVIEKLPKEAQTFDIDYEDEAKTSFEKTNLERLEIGSLILSTKTDKLDSTMNSFRKETNQNFITMEDKYGDISKQMVKTESTISKLTEEFVKSNQTNAELVKTLIDKLDKIIK